MPKKSSSWGQQEYVPAGNGDASGEYADEQGGNKHFEVFKKPTLELKSVEDETKTEKLLEKPKFKKFKKEEVALEETKQATDFKTALKETKKYVKSLSAEETKEVLTDVYENLIDKNKIENLNEKQLKDLLVAASILDIEQSFKGEQSEAKSKENLLKELKNQHLDSLWIHFPQTAKDFEISIEKKIEYFKIKGEDYTDIVGELENIKNGELLKKWKESTNNIDLSKYKKLVDKYYNENDLYSQTAKDNAKWFKTVAESKKAYSPYANKIINE